ncbi:arginase family protein [Actinoplanes sp. CA-015351]|uniref:arginase family protein n=1 Tax=Actinoplanes sp. CA-015351 TaxID=3239897 RepID=UPI003D978766
MTTILVPYHHDERLSSDDIVVAADVTVAPVLSDGDLWQRITDVCTAAAAAVTPVVAAGSVPVVFSGDCLVAGGTVAGVQRAGIDPAVVWFDAHGDVHTLETSGSGYLGGMSVRVLTGAHRDRYADRFGLTPLAPERVVLADARDLDPAEASYLATSATRRIPVGEVSENTVPPGPLVIHLDLDVIDADELPGLRFPVRNGPSASEVLATCERLIATGRVVAVDVAAPWWPTSDDVRRSARAMLLSRLASLRV